MPRPIYVDEWELRLLFNSEEYWEKVKSGQWTYDILEDGHPASDESGQPYCTRSQFIAYLDESGDEVARVHQYLRRDGTVGGSGRPDPKTVFFEGRLYKVRERRRPGH